jgi:hypothetical protein
VDTAKAEEKLSALLTAKPHYAKREEPPPPERQVPDLHAGHRETDQRQAQRPSFGEAMRGASRRPR